MDHETGKVLLAAAGGAGIVSFCDIALRLVIGTLTVYYIWLRIQKLKGSKKDEEDEL